MRLPLMLQIKAPAVMSGLLLLLLVVLLLTERRFLLLRRPALLHIVASAFLPNLFIRLISKVEGWLPHGESSCSDSSSAVAVAQQAGACEGHRRAAAGIQACQCFSSMQSLSIVL
jgi:hypothetical protein